MMNPSLRKYWKKIALFEKTGQRDAAEKGTNF